MRQELSKKYHKTAILKDRYKHDIILISLGSRLLVILLQLISNVLIPDHHAGVFLSPKNPDTIYSRSDNIIHYIFSGLTSWDGQYFYHIIKYGYTYENTLVFYPFYPFLVKLFAIPFFKLPLNSDTIYLLIAVLLNIFFFVQATLTLYRLTISVFHNRKLAYFSSILFCFNPASIFFSALYTESLFAWLSFTAMYLNFEKVTTTNSILLGMVIGFSGATRSNGLVNIGFILFLMLSSIIKRNFKSIMLISIPISLIPFLFVQIYEYLCFCSGFNEHRIFLIDYAVHNNLKLPNSDNFPPWCSQSIPLPYVYVQKQYWNVGLFNYYEFKQIPNFLLALPILFLCFQACWYFFKFEINVFRYFYSKTFVFVVHLLFLVIFCLVFVHIQISTRMLCSASPMLYWYCASEWIAGDAKKNQDTFWFKIKELSHFQKFISFYFFAYLFVGTVMFANFLPWT